MDTREQTHAHEFRELIRSLCGEDVGKCIQCGKCTAGCPVAAEQQHTPNQVMQLIRMNAQDELLQSDTFWICASCQTCSARCPEDIDIAAIMNALRKLALQRDIEPGDAGVPRLNRCFLKSIRAHGRVYEFGLVMNNNMRSGHPFKDASLGPAMFGKGKIAALPHNIKSRKRVRKIIEEAKKYE